MILRHVYLWYRLGEVRRLLADAERSRQVQHAVLAARLRRHAESDFGRDHGLAGVRTLADFRRQVPLTTYEYYAPYIERLKRGELTAMFAPDTKLHMFALTSGTTGDAKYIPVTHEFFQEYRRGWHLWGLRNYADHIDLMRKKTVGLASNWQQFCTEGGTPCGNISGLVTQLAPMVSRPIFLIPWTLTKIGDPLAKQYTTLRVSLTSRRVGMLMTANPSTLINLARMADVHRESLIRDIHDGTLTGDIHVPDDVRGALAHRLRQPYRERARELEKIVERTGHLYPRDIWPKLSMLALWLGGSVGAFLPRLKEYYGELALRDHGLSASEGRMTIPLEDGTSAGILEFIHHFFEFIPEEEHDRPQPICLEAHELEAGKNYYIVLTTSSGLYRYDIHDLVRCVGYRGTAPVLEFLNKGRSFSNLTGEKLSEFQVVSAVKEAFQELSLPIETFTVAPSFGDPPGYVLLVEQGACGGRPEALARAIDQRLARLNCEYANRLETRRLNLLVVREVPPGTWAEFRSKRINRVGGNFDQYKHPCLVHDLHFIDDLLGTEAKIASGGPVSPGPAGH